MGRSRHVGRETATLMRQHDIGAIPIGENDRLIGMVTDRDIVCRCITEGLDPKTPTARNVMTEGIVFRIDKQELDAAARIMEMKKIRRLPVMNGKKRMIGILSLGDVLPCATTPLGRRGHAIRLGSSFLTADMPGH